MSVGELVCWQLVVQLRAYTCLVDSCVNHQTVYCGQALRGSAGPVKMQNTPADTVWGLC